MAKSSKKSGKGRSNSAASNQKHEFLKEDRLKAPKLPSPGSDTDSSGEESGDSTKTVRCSLREKQEKKPRLTNKKTMPHDSEATSEDEEQHGSRGSKASVTETVEQSLPPLSEEFPALVPSQVGTSVEERRGKGSPLQRPMQADKKLFKALSVIAAEASGNEVVSTQVNLIINEVAKVKSLILEATHEVAGLQGELRATRETMNTGSKQSMAEVVRKSIPGDLDRRPTSPKPKEAIVVRSATPDKEELTELICENIDPCSLGLRDVEMRPSRDGVVITSTSKEAISSLQRELETNAATRRTVEVTQGRKRFPQIKIVGISEDITDEELPARLVTQNNLQCTAEDFTLAKSWRGREGKTACFEITKQAHEALRGRMRLNLKWTRCRFFDSTFVPRCKNCAQLGHVEKFCQEASRCTDCGGAHHLRQCKSHHKSCRACERAFPGENREHSFLSYDCPVFRQAQSRRTTQLIAHL
ncbi:hypothetical protein HPB52_009831 [Rhipicephalus sanguineus]|uniref:CCHC-type domain-containing protein n=1 Tax=Rhipicephalus sanguineus TaxID=34632 RepID=A0A9D4Q5C7_RHISA|nr:hypothetical protein HPB52_009831 [Rhipicephalus sanguineus]